MGGAFGNGVGQTCARRGVPRAGDANGAQLFVVVGKQHGMAEMFVGQRARFSLTSQGNLPVPTMGSITSSRDAFACSRTSSGGTPHYAASTPGPRPGTPVCVRAYAWASFRVPSPAHNRQ